MSSCGVAQFDPAAYKRGTREQWQNAAEAWHRWGPQLEAWLGPATEEMLDLAKVGTGSRVLDVGSQDLSALVPRVCCSTPTSRRASAMSS